MTGIQAVQPDSITAREPATGAVIGTFPVTSPAKVVAAVARARRAGAWWAALSFADRARRLGALTALLARRADEVALLVHRETGKPADGAFLEVLLAIEHLRWAARHAPRVLGRRRIRSTFATLEVAASVEHRPHGVIGVIGPWNYPLHTPMGSISYALAAGNAVVFKPSELASAVGTWIGEAVAEVVPEHPLLQVVTGGAATGEALVTSGVDKIAFTGSAATGRRVLAAAAQTLTPVVLELGGKDACIVAEDADVDAAAAGAVWAGLANAGQTCAGVERVYVADAVYPAFLEAVVARAGALRAGADPGAAIGPMTLPAQVDVVRAHLEDALARGARAVVGGPAAIRPPFVDPIVLVDVPEDARVMREETFGPVLPVVRVRDADEGVRRANASTYALGAAVYSRRRGTELAGRLRAGMVGVNGVLHFAGIPALPFGGSGESGFGRVHGAEGLREMAVPRAVTTRRLRLPFETNSFRQPAWVYPVLGRLAVLRSRSAVAGRSSPRR